jgi:hypothetical protein
MIQRIMRRGIAALALALALFLSLPAEAAGPRTANPKIGSIGEAWNFLVNWLDRSIFLPDQPTTHSNWKHEFAEDGGAIDPNGRTNALACRDDGGCIDPNG